MCKQITSVYNFLVLLETDHIVLCQVQNYVSKCINQSQGDFAQTFWYLECLFLSLPLIFMYRIILDYLESIVSVFPI